MRDNNVLPFTVLAWAVLLLSPALSHSETLVNASFDPPAITGQSYDPTAVAEGPAGTFNFIATFCNKATSQPLGDRLESGTAVLTGGNELLNRTWGSGASSILEFPQTGGYANLNLAPGDCVPITYEIGLQQRAPFQFFVDIWLKQVIYSNGYVNLRAEYSTEPVAEDFVLQSGANVIGGVRWNGVNPVPGIDPGNSFTIRIYESHILGSEPRTDYDNPIYQEDVTASRVPTSFSNLAGVVYEYRADLATPFTATPGATYYLAIANANGKWGWSWGYLLTDHASQWAGSGWSYLANDRFSFTLTD